MIPFAIMLLAIAIAPMVVEKWWESNRNKLIVSCVLGIPVAAYMLMQGLTHELIHTIFFDYVPFIILLLALFVITGGIHLSGDIKAKPWVNTLFLAIGFCRDTYLVTCLQRTDRKREFMIFAYHLLLHAVNLQSYGTAIHALTANGRSTRHYL